MEYSSELSSADSLQWERKALFFATRLLLFAALLCGAPACKQKPPPKTKQQIMQEKLEERLAIWKADMTANCMEKALEKAVLIVDSTLIANARQHRDLSGKPAIPPRPEKPDFVVPADSLPVKPLLQRGN